MGQVRRGIEVEEMDEMKAEEGDGKLKEDYGERNGEDSGLISFLRTDHREKKRLSTVVCDV